MKLKTTSILLLGAILLSIVFSLPVSAALIPVTAAEKPGSVSSDSLPSIQEFTSQAANGSDSLLTGIYVQDVLAYTVAQQPEGYPAFVSTDATKVTQFGMASQYGSTGILAHNYLAGADFFNLKVEQIITLVYGSGRMANYRITAVRHLQALSPTSPYSRFADLDVPGQEYSVTEMFNQIYNQADRLVLQTCIQNGTVDSWGRLFVIAEPVDSATRAVAGALCTDRCTR